MSIVLFIAMLGLIYTLGWLEINIWAAMFALVFGGLLIMCIF